MKNNPRPFSPWLLLPLLLAGAGCASTPAADQAAKDDEYIYVQVTGSNIPKRIKRSALATDDLPKDGDMQVIDKEQFMKSMGPGKKIDRGS
ncbi:MAG: hypothetical protein ABUL61_03605 [Oleiharenicola lentus]